MKKVMRVVGVLLIVLVVVVVVKTLTFRSMQIEVEPVTLPDFGAQSEANLSRALSIPTISYEMDMPIDSMAFRDFHRFLEEAYPLIHARLQKEVFSEFSLLFTWTGRNSVLKPVVLLAHMDVVPAPDAERWVYPPFSGAHDGTFIWGRGAIDDKGRFIAILEAVERLLEEGFTPACTIYLAFGHDEEISGAQGAAVMAKALGDRGVEAAFILDEGMLITRGVIPMLNKAAATIGIAEKGYMSVRLKVEMEGGHSSIPEHETAVAVLHQALHKLIHKPMKAGLSLPVKNFFRYTGPEMPFLPRMVFANLWLFERLVLKIYQSSNTGNASVRTIGTPTILEAGLKDNIVPTTAQAVVNFRIITGETSADVLDYIHRTVSDERVQVSVVESVHEPSPVSPLDSPGFNLIHTTIKQVFPEVIVNPMVALGATDSRFYVDLSPNIYRFAPLTLHQEDLARIHGLNERISIEDYKRAIGFYYQLLINL